VLGVFFLVGRKRSDVKKVQVNVEVPLELRDALKEAGANFTQLFLNAAYDFLDKHHKSTK